MDSAPEPPDPRGTVLELLADFVDRLLPAALRKLAQWKGFDSARQFAVVEDLRQELAVDALSHATELATLPVGAVHARWFRLVQSVHYRLCVRPARRDVGAGGNLDHLPCRDRDVAERLDARVGEQSPIFAQSRRDLDRVASAAVHLQNGRLNALATARKLGMTKREFRELWERLTSQLGFGSDFVDYWRARLREAGARLAIDLLRSSGALHTFGTADRCAPADPAAHTRRIKRVRIALSSHPHHHDTKRVFVEALSRRHRDPTALLEAVAQLGGVPRGRLALWQFEAAIANDELDRAAQHLADATAEPAAVEHDGLRVPCALAAARLFEARGNPGRAIESLERARRDGDDARLQISLLSLERGFDCVE